MALIPKFFKKHDKKPILKASSLIDNIDEGSLLGHAILGGSSLNPRQAAQFYQSSPAVATAVDMIADEVEQLRPFLIDKLTGEATRDHPILNLLDSPNPVDDRRSFIGILARDWLLNRDSFVLTVGNIRREPLELWPVKCANINIVEGSDSYAESYILVKGVGVGSYYRNEDIGSSWRYTANDLQELLHIRGFSSRSTNLHGDSPLLAVSTEIRQNLAGSQHNLAVLNNGGRLSLVVIMKDTLDEEEHNRRKNAIKQQLGGAGNSGKIAVISSEDMEIQEFGKSNKDMDFSTLSQMSENAVYKRYKIPLPLVTVDASTYNNVENAKYDLYDRAVLPVFDVLMQGLAKNLFPRMGIDPNRFTLSYNSEEIPALRGRMIDELKQRSDINIETVNELRSLLPNRPDISGGDEVLRPSGLVPISQSLLDLDVAAQEEVSE